MSDNTKQTVIEDGTEFEGSIQSTCDIQLSGKAKGQVRAPSLTVTPSGSVSGKVKVERLKSEGEIAGQIDADSVELSGKVNDDTVINAKTLQVKLAPSEGGVRVSFGNCKLQVGARAGGQQQAKTEDAQGAKHGREEKHKRPEPQRL